MRVLKSIVFFSRASLNGRIHTRASANPSEMAVTCPYCQPFVIATERHKTSIHVCDSYRSRSSIQKIQIQNNFTVWNASKHWWGLLRAFRYILSPWLNHNLRNWTTFLTCNTSRKYWLSDKCSCRSFHSPEHLLPMYCAQLNAERHYTNSLAKTWTTIGRLDPTAGGRNEVPDHEKLAAAAWVTTVAVERRPLAGEHRRLCSGWKETPEYCFGSIHAYTVAVISTDLLT
jgi:hypothetical protein